MSKRKDLRTAEHEWRTTRQTPGKQPARTNWSLPVRTVVKALLVLLPIVLYLTY